MADSKIIHQAITTNTPLSLSSRVGRPMTGGTREAMRGSMIIVRRDLVKHRRTICHESLLRYNQLPLSTKLSGRKTTFRKEIRRFVMTSRTPYLRQQYDDISMAPFTDRRPAPTDITYTVDVTGALRRNLISHSQYNT